MDGNGEKETSISLTSSQDGDKVGEDRLSVVGLNSAAEVNTAQLDSSIYETEDEPITALEPSDFPDSIVKDIAVQDDDSIGRVRKVLELGSSKEADGSKGSQTDTSSGTESFKEIQSFPIASSPHLVPTADSMSSTNSKDIPPLPVRQRSPTRALSFTKISSKTEPSRRVSSDFDLIVNRWHEKKQELIGLDEKSQQIFQNEQMQLKKRYTKVLETIPVNGREPEHHEEVEEYSNIDWNFWTLVVEDFSYVAENDSENLEKAVSNGVPAPIRGIIWKLISNATSCEIKELYHELLNIPSEHEKAIKRDIMRTNYIPSDKVDSLFNVLKAYSLFDPDVGYTQGMAFITAPLLLNVSDESEAMELLIKLMKNYGLREFFLPEMPGLQLKLYQFERVLEVSSPTLYNYLIRSGIRSSMYATQWFLTFFAYKFPLDFVLRIVDVIFFEGIESLLKFAVVLLLKNESTLLTLNFEKLVQFLKDGLFYYYLKQNVEYRRSEQKDRVEIKFEGLTDITSTKMMELEYDIDEFVHDAINHVKITPIQLRNYAAEYEEIHRLELEKEIEIEGLRRKNRQLQNEMRTLKHEYTDLNREHISLANELIKRRVEMETLIDENQDLKQTIIVLKDQFSNEVRKRVLPERGVNVPSDLKLDLDNTMRRNLEVMDHNQVLEEKLLLLENEIQTLKMNNTKLASDKSKDARLSTFSALSRTKANKQWSFKAPW
ncbi:HER149Wp [Eremothecium sinecaudum]|uniref:GTPase-activating protein GYP5 n=1 Tax=Eremothecium sinecaudum TaxID=45286 RepID=A0A0X8HU32_9SACH|nr:HER149Wp [Eremothecium sinecaudum]AMD21428.1 HER149Wp [Eremothecium sinecaudum]